jgi:hypothetical protein
MGEQSGVDVVSMRVTEGDKVEIEGIALDVLYCRILDSIRQTASARVALPFLANDGLGLVRSQIILLPLAVRPTHSGPRPPAAPLAGARS